LEGGVAENGDFRRGGQDALYPALSGEWEVPVTRNAKITLHPASPIVSATTSIQHERECPSPGIAEPPFL
jgi:hypothetical protein